MDAVCCCMTRGNHLQPRLVHYSPQQCTGCSLEGHRVVVSHPTGAEQCCWRGPAVPPLPLCSVPTCPFGDTEAGATAASLLLDLLFAEHWGGRKNFPGLQASTGTLGTSWALCFHTPGTQQGEQHSEFVLFSGHLPRGTLCTLPILLETRSEYKVTQTISVIAQLQRVSIYWEINSLLGCVGANVGYWQKFSALVRPCSQFHQLLCWSSHWMLCDYSHPTVWCSQLLWSAVKMVGYGPQKPIWDTKSDRKAL